MIISYCFVDLRLTIFLNNIDHDHHWTTLIANQLNKLGNGLPYLIVAGLVFLGAVIKKNKAAAWKTAYFILAIIISGLACDVLKVIAGRARPYEFFTYGIYGFYFWKFASNFWSLPSGHVVTISAIATAGYLLVRRFGWFFCLLVILVFCGRLMSRAHYLSDVVIGAYLGFIIAFWLYHWLSIWRRT